MAEIDQGEEGGRAPVLRVRLEGDDARLGKIPASDLANLLQLVERAVARAASVEVGRPSRRTGRREKVVAEASHLVLVGIEEGSIVPVLALPAVSADSEDLQQAAMTNDAQLSEVAVGRVLDVLSGRRDGHPYVVEAIAQLAEELGIGDRYSGISFELTGKSVESRVAMLDESIASQMRQRVERFRSAAKEGLLVGTLVEADFEAFTARLRSVDGSPIAVTFDPSMSSEIKEALTEEGALQGWITYDPVTVTAQSIELQKVVRSYQATLDFDPEAFGRHRTFGELQADQGVTGEVDVDQLADSESPAAELDAYDAALRRLADA